MLAEITAQATDPAAEAALRQQIAAHVTAVRASAGGGQRAWVRQAETAVRADPATAFQFDPDGAATLAAADRRWHAGRFETVSIGALRARLAPGGGGKLRLWVLDGASPATDIGALQATAEPDTLFQVASQFNCLESPGPFITDVAAYLSDPTQGPRASVSAFPATLLRHYAAPGADGGRYVQQSDGPQIDLLADAIGPGVVRNGYLTGPGTADVVAGVESRFEAIQVGVHADAQVVLGYNWDGAVSGGAARRVAQVFTSTLAGGGYGGERAFSKAAFQRICRQLLRAAYLGTLLAAADLRQRRVVLTLIGGGVFGNPAALIWDAILWAADAAAPLLAQDLDVILNGYSLGRQSRLETLLPAVRQRGGAIVEFDGAGITAVWR